MSVCQHFPCAVLSAPTGLDVLSSPCCSFLFRLYRHRSGNHRVFISACACSTCSISFVCLFVHFFACTLVTHSYSSGSLPMHFVLELSRSDWHRHHQFSQACDQSQLFESKWFQVSSKTQSYSAKKSAVQVCELCESVARITLQ